MAGRRLLGGFVAGGRRIELRAGARMAAVRAESLWAGAVRQAQAYQRLYLCHRPIVRCSSMSSTACAWLRSRPASGQSAIRHRRDGAASSIRQAKARSAPLQQRQGADVQQLSTVMRDSAAAVHAGAGADARARSVRPTACASRCRRVGQHRAAKIAQLRRRRLAVELHPQRRAVVLRQLGHWPAAACRTGRCGQCRPGRLHSGGGAGTAGNSTTTTGSGQQQPREPPKRRASAGSDPQAFCASRATSRVRPRASSPAQSPATAMRGSSPARGKPKEHTVASRRRARKLQRLQRRQHQQRQSGARPSGSDGSGTVPGRQRQQPSASRGQRRPTPEPARARRPAPRE